MIYPADRWVTEKQLRLWYSDAIANKEVDDPLLRAEDYLTEDIHFIVGILQDTGKFTFSGTFEP